MNVLNPALYDALRKVFRHVGISNQGIRLNGYHMEGLDGIKRLRVTDPGEYYVVSCPFCRDTGKHLYINHCWGVRDSENGRRNLWLAHCFLNECLRDWEKRKALADMLCAYDLRSRSGLVVVEHRPPTEPLIRHNLPSDYLQLKEFPPNWNACRYVRSRGFSPRELSDVWKIGYSLQAYRGQPRLVIPIYACFMSFDDLDELEQIKDIWGLATFQSRALCDADEPKYYFMPGSRKSQLLYGINRVPRSGDSPIVVCEGVTDVWRFGPGAVAIFGKSISEEQCKLLRTFFPGRDIVVMLDPDAASEAQVVAQRIEEVLERDLRSGIEPGWVYVAHLPGDNDPGDSTQEELQKVVRAALGAIRKGKR